MLRVLCRKAGSDMKALLLRLNVVVLPGTKAVLNNSDYTEKLSREAAQLTLPLATFLSAKAVDGDVRTIGTLITLEKNGKELVASAALKGSAVELLERDHASLLVRKLRAPVEKSIEPSEVLSSLNGFIRHMNKLSRFNLNRFESNIRSSRTLSEFFYALPYMAEVDYEPKRALKELQLLVHKAAVLLPYCLDGFDFSHLQSVLEAQRLAEKVAIVKRMYTDIFSAVNTKHLSLAKAAEAAQLKSGNEVRKLAIKMLQEEVGTSNKNKVNELRAHFESVTLPDKTRKLIMGELDRMATMFSESHEFDKLKTYMNHLYEMPFGKFSEEHIDFAEVQKSLNESHYGMLRVKERITEFLAIKKLKKEEQKGSVILLLGPPGVGKSSVGKAIAAALHRPVRIISLGGCSEASFIRGHSRTYTGSKPGVFVRELQRAGVMNPVFVLDEIDKMGSSAHHGDPQSALLDALNDEQNHDFHDDYLDMGIDLSKVLFILTANSDSHILDPLRNRLEVIEMPAYLVSEKTQIAQHYLLPDVLSKNGLSPTTLVLGDEAITGIIKHFIESEAGVRQLKKGLDKITRKLAVETLDKGTASLVLETYEKTALQKYLGTPKQVDFETYHLQQPVGKVNGLAVTGFAGQIMEIEVVAMPKLLGPNTFEVTGNLKQVMSESVRNSRMCAARFSQLKGLGRFFQKTKIAVNFVGAAPKDGPSAGAAISIALLSLAQNQPVVPNLAITGSIDLNFRVGRVGGIREKVTAAKTSEITRVCLPTANKADWDDLPEEVRKGMTPIFVKTLEELFAVAFEKETMEPVDTGSSHGTETDLPK